MIVFEFNYEDFLCNPLRCDELLHPIYAKLFHKDSAALHEKCFSIFVQLTDLSKGCLNLGFMTNVIARHFFNALATFSQRRGIRYGSKQVGQIEVKNRHLLEGIQK